MENENAKKVKCEIPNKIGNLFFATVENVAKKRGEFELFLYFCLRSEICLFGIISMRLYDQSSFYFLMLHKSE